jgi:transposase
LTAEIKQLTLLVTQLQGRLGQTQAELEATQEKVAHLETENARLRYELNEMKQAPFKSKRGKQEADSQDEEPPQSGKRAGRKKGHKGSGRQRPQRIDRMVRVEVGATCPDCGHAFSSTAVERTRDLTDIEPIRPTINTRFIIERGWCPQCRRYHESPVVEALPQRRFGFNLMLFVVYQKVALGLSYGKIQRELSIYFGLTISKGELSNIVAEMSRLFGPAYGRLLRLMRQQSVLHVDETGWRVNGTNHWLWIFVNEVVALFVLSKSRGSKVPRALLGSDFSGHIVSDFYSAYSPLAVAKAKCWAHLLRESHQLMLGKPPPPSDSDRVQFHQQLHQLYLDMGLALLEAEVDPSQRPRVHAEMRQSLLELAQQPWPDKDCQRLAKRILKYLDELVAWLAHPDIPADNNLAERSLRPAVVTRKTSFGSRSKQGGQAFARLLSVIMSWDKQDIDFFESGYGVLRNAVCS